jgi:N-acetyl-anhydromuramyl-L-alanine amidase AmpD
MAQTWYPGANRRPGPAQKAQGMNNPAKGVVLHSMVGYRSGAYSVLDTVTGPRRTVAWHFSVYQNGTVEQHYPLEAVLHHAGDWGDDNDGANGNGELIGIEHEGGFSPVNEPLTERQSDASVELVRWIAQQRGWVPSRSYPRTLWEHREISNEPTECPSGRIPWHRYTPKEEGHVDRDYTVIRPGEWLSKVAQRVGKSVDELVSLNQIADPNKVEAFQILRLHTGVALPERRTGDPEVDNLLGVAISEAMRAGTMIDEVKRLVTEARLKLK